MAGLQALVGPVALAMAGLRVWGRNPRQGTFSDAEDYSNFPQQCLRRLGTPNPMFD